MLNGSNRDPRETSRCMSSQSTSKVKSLYDTVRGYEPPPPIGDYDEPPSKGDKRQMYAQAAPGGTATNVILDPGGWGEAILATEF